MVPDDSLWSDPSYWSEPAEQTFSKAMARAHREVVVDRLRGRRTTLVPFDEVSTDRMPQGSERSATVHLTLIVGSVGKEDLFSRSFLPLSETLLARWKKVYALAQGLHGYEPVELYEVDGLFYVVDGHFRVSVARALGNETIQARIRSWT